MGYKCCVPNCKSNYDGYGISLPTFGFPRNEELRKKWIENICRKDFVPTKHSRVCEKHFQEDQIVRVDSAIRPDGSVLTVPRKNIKLKHDAYPCVFDFEKKVGKVRERKSISSKASPEGDSVVTISGNTVQDDSQNQIDHSYSVKASNKKMYQPRGEKSILGKENENVLNKALPQESSVGEISAKAAEGDSQSGIQIVSVFSMQVQEEEADKNKTMIGSPQADSVDDIVGNIMEDDSQNETNTLVRGLEKVQKEGTIQEIGSSQENNTIQDTFDHNNSVTDFNSFSVNIATHFSDSLWISRLTISERKYWNFYYISDTSYKAKPFLAVTIRVFHDMSIEVFTTADCQSEVLKVQQSDLKWALKDDKLATWALFESLIDFYSKLTHPTGDPQNADRPGHSDAGLETAGESSDVHFYDAVSADLSLNATADIDDNTDPADNQIFVDKESSNISMPINSNVLSSSTNTVMSINSFNQSFPKASLSPRSTRSLSDHIDKLISDNATTVSLPNRHEKWKTKKRRSLQNTTTGRLARGYHVKRKRVEAKVPRTKVNVQCDMCGKLLAAKNHLVNHMHIHTGERPFMCHLCGQTFKEPAHKQRHINRIHLKRRRFFCSYCHRGFYEKFELDTHIGKHTTGELKCDVCEKSFPCKSQLRKHVKMVHKFIWSKTKDKTRWSCTVCGKGLASLGQLREHEDTHSTVPSHFCHICNKGFKSANYLRKHLIRHEPNFRHFCDICSKGYHDMTSLNYHKATAHTEVRPFSCPKCPQRFKTKYQLKRHMEKIHKEQHE